MNDETLKQLATLVGVSTPEGKEELANRQEEVLRRIYRAVDGILNTRPDDEARRLLAELGAWVVEQCREELCGDLEGFEIQEVMDRIGVIEQQARFAPCGEDCRCAEFADGYVTCRRLHPAVIAYLREGGVDGY